jgi:NAD(P)-dependent dehydrogenase (short-subunit alcohol dehydrogenase family)
MGLLDGKVAVITGGSRGLGLGIAQAFAQAGAAVVVASRSPKSVDEAVQDIRAIGGQAQGMALDVTSLEQVQALAQFTLAQYGKFDIWVNNAGTAGPYGPTVGFTPQDFSQVVQTNMMGVYHGSLIAMRHFLANHSGKLINILGHGYNRPVPWQNAYGASKAWVRSFTMALAAETKDSGVGVFAFNPGLVLTDLLTDVDVIAGSENRLKVFPTIVRMWAKPPEIPAKKAIWIASSATDGKTGKLISLFSPWTMLSGALKEGLRVILRRPAPNMAIRMKSIPPYLGKGL